LDRRNGVFGNHVGVQSIRFSRIVFDRKEIRAETQVGLKRTNQEYRMSSRFGFYSMIRDRQAIQGVRIYGMYKPKAKKVRPVDSSETTGNAPVGIRDWQEAVKATETPVVNTKGQFSEWIIPKFSDIERGSRLTPERVKTMKVGDMLTYEERELLMEMLFNREAALGWDLSHLRRIREEVAPPQVIHTIPHTPWQEKGFSPPKALLPVVIEMLRERMDAGIFEYCSGPYRNSWFLIGKKETKKYRIIKAAQQMNKHTLRDANLPPNADDFAESFAGSQVASLVDFLSGYDQIPLDPKSRDITAFMTPLGLLRQTTLPQGATNSVAQFVRIVTRILEDLIPDICLPFLDDIGVKGPRTNHNNAKDRPGIRKYIRLHIQ